MNTRSVSVRQAVAIAASAAVLMVATWVGSASAAVSRAASSPTDSAISSPPAVSICCPGYTSSGSGLTTSGQASVRGQGTAVRDTAIAKAVADATDQAEVAAKAAGITLGAIIDMQVSAPYFAPYPMEASAVGSGVVGKTGVGMAVPVGDPGYVSGGSAPGAPPFPTQVPVETFASVTITWSIA